jgi:LytS/YehU family sensor histidine kinase
MLIKVLPPFWKTFWFKITASLLIALGGYGLFRWRLHIQESRQNRSLQLAQSELKAIRSQMNPHFIFNCMTAIDALIATGQSRKASAYLAKFSKLVRQVLQLSEKQLISLADELNTLKLYLQLEQLRMQDAFDFSFEIAEGLEEMVEIPPMLLQPFLENAIIHGLKPSLKPQKQIHVSAGKEAGKVIFNIEDNGVGRRPGNINPGKHHTSMGIKLTGDRLKMMEQVLPMKTNYFYTDLFDNGGTPSGTRVTIELTYQN